MGRVKIRVGQYRTYALVAGGYFNTALGTGTAVSGGYANQAYGAAGTIVGGHYNEESGIYGVTVGGSDNSAVGDWSVVVGGMDNSAGYNHSAVVGGSNNLASGAYAWIGGGNNNTSSGTYATVTGGGSNTAYANGGAIFGGSFNDVYGMNEVDGVLVTTYNTVVGGMDNTAGDSLLDNGSILVAGGVQNSATGDASVAVGGESSTAAGDWQTAIGSIWYARDTDHITTIAGRSAGAVLGGAAAVAQCRTVELESGVSNTTIDALAIPEGSTGDETCALVGWGCLEAMYNYASGGDAETNTTSCGTRIDYTGSVTVGAWACCSR